MGFSEAVSKRALAKCVWDVNKALDLLFACGGDLQEDEAPDRGAEMEAPAAPSGPSKAQAEAPLELHEAAVSPSPPQREKPQLAAKEQTPHSEAWRPAPAPASKAAVGDSGTDASTVSTTVSTASSPRSAGRCDKALLQKERDSPQVVTETPQTPAVVPCAADSEDPSWGAPGRQLAPAPLGDAPLPPLPVETPEEAPPAVCNEVVAVAEEVEEEVEEAPAAEADTEAAAEDDGPPPRKTIERAETAWPGEEGSYAVSAGDFIRVWADSKTEHGWIYAEDLTDGGKVGWLPAFQLQELSAGKRWMLCIKSCEAIHDTQLSVKEGEVLLVTTGSHTNEGWCYAEHADKASAAAAGGPMAGWAPIFCIEWAE